MSTIDHDITRVLATMHFEDVQHHTLLLVFAVLVAGTLVSAVQYLAQSGNRSFWNTHQWAGPQNRLFAKTRAGIDGIRHTREIVGKGYESVCCSHVSASLYLQRDHSNQNSQFSKKNVPFILPKFGNNPVVVLPPSQVRELVRKPDDEVDLHIIHWEQLANRYTSRPEVFLNPIHLSVVRRQLTRKLPTFSDDLYREMTAAFASNWGTEKESFSQVGVYRSCIKIVSRAANRVLSGVELCTCSDEPSSLLKLTVRSI